MTRLLIKLADDPPGTPFLVLRHGNAVKRVDWAGDDVDRPLDASGVAQADELVGRLAAYGVERVHSSAARRCSDTVRPYSLAAGVPLASEPALTEDGFDVCPRGGARASWRPAGRCLARAGASRPLWAPALPASACRPLGRALPWRAFGRSLGPPAARHHADGVHDCPPRSPGRAHRPTRHSGPGAPPRLTLCVHLGSRCSCSVHLVDGGRVTGVSHTRQARVTVRSSAVPCTVTGPP